MLTQKKISGKKTLVYSLIVIITLAVIGFILYRTFWFSAKETAPNTYSAAIDLPAPLETDFNKKIFSNRLFDSLQEHGDLPVKVQQQGKNDPFQQRID